MFKKTNPFRKRSTGDSSQDGVADPVERDVDLDTSSSSSNSKRPALRSRSEGAVTLTSHFHSIDEQLKAPSRQFSSFSSETQVSKIGEASGDPLGLKVLHTPPGERRVDIVFVHGLGGSSRLSWSKNHNLDLFWPLKFLPFEPDIKDARLLTFGYNANFKPGAGKSKMSVLDFAKDLLYDLKYAKDESENLEDLMMGERPIIFMVHSMGGLVVKEAYMQGQNDPAYASIIKSVSSIIFLSTPHRGTNLAETLNRILQVSFVTNPMQFIAELANGSQTLQKLNEQFRHVAPKLQIVSFYETRPTTMFKKTQIMVLEKDSSVLGYPGEVSKPLDADHHGVCKYESPDDPLYITVRNVLKTLVGKAKPNIESRKNSRSGTSLNFEEYLSVSESPEGDYNFFRDQWVSGTCNWVLNEVAFSSWLEDDRCDPRVLWIHGNAASGKSILSSFVIDHLVQLGLPCQYFFVRFEHKKKQMLSLILRTMACQLANSLPSYAEKLRQLEAAATDLATADYRNIWQWLYKQSLFQLAITFPLYWVIDGVDEAESPESVIRVLSDLHLTDIPIRVLVVSRNTHEISSAFQKLARQVHLETLRTEGSQEDFLHYINQEIDVAGNASYREEIIAQILERARGNFLWVHLAVKRINKCHRKEDVDDALKDLPPGMEALYDRMAHFVQTQAPKDQMLAEIILGWATCAQRPLSIEELRDALGTEGLLEIHRTIGDLCGGFVVVDKEGKVAMVHATAREYLLGGDNRDRPLIIERRRTNNKLFKRCISRLMDPAVRSQMNKNLVPALLDYATSSWFIHLSHGSATDPDILEILLKFLRGQYILLWINLAAKTKQLRALVAASRYLTDVALKLRRLDEGKSLVQHQAVEVIAGWATDLVKIVGKFGNSLRENPESIHKLIPPFCPEDSTIYQQFGRKENKTLRVSGFASSSWDDCLARFSLEQGFTASAVHAAGSYIVILANRQTAGHIIIYNSITFEEKRRITHPERVFKIQVDQMGETLVSYGYTTTRVWKTATAECVKVVKNPAKRPRPQTLLFLEQESVVLVGSEDRCIRSLKIGDDDESSQWEIKAHIEEQSLDDTVLNAPTCSALSPDGSMIAYGYRGHPVSLWELDPLTLVSQYNMTSHEADMTIQENILGEIVQLTWHPFFNEVLGLHREGLLFRWDPYDEENSATVHTGAHYLAVSRDGSLVATGDTVGTVKVYSTPDLSLLYQLSSQDSVLHLSFSTDSRRLYDVRGMFGNVWEPGALVRLADSSEYPDHNSETSSENGSLAKLSLHTQHLFPRVDNVITLCGQSVRPLYCYGTEDGVAFLCEVGQGKVCELERLTSYMSIEQVAWSDDGRFAAIADLSGRLALKTIAKEGEDRDTWQVHHDFHVMIPSHNGHISQLLFHPTTHRVFAYTPTALYAIDITTQDLVESKLPSDMPKVKWICHPTLPEYLLGFGNAKVYVFSWAKLKEVEIYTYIPLRLWKTATISSKPLHGRGSSFMAAEEFLGRLISHVDSPDILLEISHLASSGRSESEFLVFKVADINVDLEHNEPNATSELPYTLLPADVTSRIREPLAFLSRGRLVFLDIDRWICTWRMHSSTRRHGVRGLEQGVEAIEQYYFLPGDWVTSNEAQLCSIMADGTLLCPRNGDVATVQCAKLRK